MVPSSKPRAWFRNSLLYIGFIGVVFAAGARAVPLRLGDIPHPTSRMQLRKIDVKQEWDEMRTWNLMANVRQAWIKSGKGQCSGYGQNEHYFKTDMTGLRVKPLSQDYLGGFSSDLYEIPSSDHSLSISSSSSESDSDSENSPAEPTPTPTHILKLVDLSHLYASCEPFALQAHKIWFQSGFIISPDEDRRDVKWGAIRMEKVPGQPLHLYRLWMKERPVEKKRILLEVRNRLFEIVYAYARQDHHLLHADFHARNVHVELSVKNKVLNVVAVHLLDFGYPGIYDTTEIPSEEEFRAWFDLRFDLLWDYVYEAVGESPPYYLKYVALVGGKVVEVNGPAFKGKELEPKEVEKRKGIQQSPQGKNSKKVRIS